MRCAAAYSKTEPIQILSQVKTPPPKLRFLYCMNQPNYPIVRWVS
jgi:hypothetical protein